VNQPSYPPPYRPQPPSQQPPYQPQYPPYGRQGQPGGYGPPPMGPPQQPFAPGPPPPPPRKSSAGKIIAIIAIVLVALLALGGFFVWRAVSGVVNSVGGLADGAGATCSAVSTQDVDAVLGGDWTVFQLGGLSSIAGPALDSRVLSDAPTTCWASQDKDGKLSRIARYQGADATAKFAAEKAKAKGSTVDKGNGLSVSSDSYLGKDVQAGDEAFCTTGDMLASAGALVRRGDTLVYVSTTAAGDGASSVPDINIDGSSTNQVSFGTDDANCALAVKLIDKVH
jgi:hypothetical protein